MTFRDRYGPWAVIAGASVGLGAEFAQQLAERGLNLVLLARRRQALLELGASLEKHGVSVRAIDVDLASPRLLEEVRAATADVEVGLLVYNAAASTIGHFLAQSLEDQLRIIDVNIRGPVILSHVLGEAMVARGRGGILLMTSIAAGQGGPFLATYAASKAFNLVFSEGLWFELRQKGVDVLACRAGATRTPGYESSRPVGKQPPMMEPGPVVKSALDSLGKSVSTVPGWINKLTVQLMGRMMPRTLAVRVMGSATRRLYPDRT
jgi:short-subunit dehydrogenase